MSGDGVTGPSAAHKSKIPTTAIAALLVGAVLTVVERIFEIPYDHDVPRHTAFLMVILNAAFVGLLWEVTNAASKRRPIQRPLAFFGVYLGCLVAGYVLWRCLVVFRPLFWLDELPLAIVLTLVALGLGSGVWRGLRRLRLR